MAILEEEIVVSAKMQSDGDPIASLLRAGAEALGREPCANLKVPRLTHDQGLTLNRLLLKECLEAEEGR